MTNAPAAKKPSYRDPEQLSGLFDDPDFQFRLSRCKWREFGRQFFTPSKPGYATTIEEWGEVYTEDGFGIRAVILYYRHSDNTTIRSIKRIVTDDGDYRLPMPNAMHSTT
jgi:hypothetical protein